MCSLSGLLPVTVWLAFHVWEVAAAAGGQGAFAERITGPTAGSLGLLVEVLLILLPLAVHIVTALMIVAKERDGYTARGYDSPGSRRLQRGSGLLALLFIGAHLQHIWLARVLGHHDAIEEYGRLAADLGTPLYLGIYIVGLSAVFLHLAEGLTAAAHTWGVAPSGPARLRVRVVTTVFAVALWVVSINSLSHFSTGRALFWQPPSEAGPLVTEPL